LRPRWDDAVEREVDLPAVRLPAAGHTFPLPLPGAVAIVASEPAGSYLRLRVRIENRAGWNGAPDRDAALRHSMISTHTLLLLEGGVFVSLMDPPEAARDAAASCRNLHTWPVLAGDEGRSDLMLSSPIILYDYPAIAPESSRETTVPAMNNASGSQMRGRRMRSRHDSTAAKASPSRIW
jgi:hypothetical protein